MADVYIVARRGDRCKNNCQAFTWDARQLSSRSGNTLKYFEAVLTTPARLSHIRLTPLRRLFRAAFSSVPFATAEKTMLLISFSAELANARLRMQSAVQRKQALFELRPADAKRACRPGLTPVSTHCSHVRLPHNLWHINISQER